MTVNMIRPDHGWAWVILLAAFFCNFTFDGIIFSFGVFYLELLDFFKAGRAETSLIGSVICGVYAIIGPIASILVNKYGCRLVTMVGAVITSTGFILSIFSPNVEIMIVTYGLMGGIGFGLMYLSAYVMIGHYFEKRRALATGLTSCGSGVGTFVFAPLSMSLIDTYGWKGAMMVISGFVLNGLVIGAVFRPIHKAERVVKVDKDSEQGAARSKEEEALESTPKTVKILDLGLLRNPSFMIFCASSFLCLIGFFVPFMYLPDFARRHGISKENGAFLLSVIGITNTIGRVICGYVSDKAWMDPLKLYNAALIIGGAATFCCTWLNNYISLVIYAALFGLCIATYVSLSAIILVEFLGLEKLSNSFGFLNMFRGIATFIGAPLAGLLFDINGSYQVAFFVAGAAITAAGIICLPLRCLHQKSTISQVNQRT